MTNEELINILSRYESTDSVVFEIVEGGKEPKVSYGVDEVINKHDFVILRSLD